MNKNNFKAQALALVMIVLVVASIIGVSLFSRMAKDKESAVNEQDSSIASTQVDAMLDFLIGADIETIETVLGDDDDTNDSYDSTEGSYSDFLVNNGIISDEGTYNELDTQWCEGESDVKLSMSYAEPSDFFEVQPGSVMPYNIGDADVDSCNLTLRLKAMDEHAVFIVKKVYDDGGVITESTGNYCISKDADQECSEDIDNVDYGENLDSIGEYDSDSEARLYSIVLEDEIANHVEEIRFIPIKGVLGMSAELSNEGCVSNRQYRPVKITAEANCNGNYRGKQMFLPGSGSLGYSTLFDYGIYDTGFFQP